jgi:hypothetical protein
MPRDSRSTRPGIRGRKTAVGVSIRPATRMNASVAGVRRALARPADPEHRVAVDDDHLAIRIGRYRGGQRPGDAPAEDDRAVPDVFAHDVATPRFGTVADRQATTSCASSANRDTGCGGGPAARTLRAVRSTPSIRPGRISVVGGSTSPAIGHAALQVRGTIAGHPFRDGRVR